MQGGLERRVREVPGTATAGVEEAGRMVWCGSISRGAVHGARSRAQAYDLPSWARTDVRLFTDQMASQREAVARQPFFDVAALVHEVCGAFASVQIEVQ